MGKAETEAHGVLINACWGGGESIHNNLQEGRPVGAASSGIFLLQSVSQIWQVLNYVDFKSQNSPAAKPHILILLRLRNFVLQSQKSKRCNVSVGPEGSASFLCFLLAILRGRFLFSLKKIMKFFLLLAPRQLIFTRCDKKARKLQSCSELPSSGPLLAQYLTCSAVPDT